MGGTSSASPSANFRSDSSTEYRICSAQTVKHANAPAGTPPSREFWKRRARPVTCRLGPEPCPTTANAKNKPALLARAAAETSASHQQRLNALPRLASCRWPLALLSVFFLLLRDSLTLDPRRWCVPRWSGGRALGHRRARARPDYLHNRQKSNCGWPKPKTEARPAPILTISFMTCLLVGVLSGLQHHAPHGLLA